MACAFPDSFGSVWVSNERSYNPAGAVTPAVWAAPRSLATTEGITVLFSLPAGTEMFQFPALAHPLGVTQLHCAGLPHSDTDGSKAVCASPPRFAANRVLLRRLEPEASPRRPSLAWLSMPACARLVTLTSKNSYRQRLSACGE